MLAFVCWMVLIVVMLALSAFVVEHGEPHPSDAEVTTFLGRAIGVCLFIITFAAVCGAIGALFRAVTGG